TKNTTLKVSEIPGGPHTFSVYAVNTKSGPAASGNFNTFDAFNKDTVSASLKRAGSNLAEVTLNGANAPAGDSGSCRATRVAGNPVASDGTFQFTNPQAQTGLKVEYTCDFQRNKVASTSVKADLAAQENPAITAIAEVESARTDTRAVINVDVSGLDVWDINSDLDLVVSGKEQNSRKSLGNDYQLSPIAERGWIITLTNLNPGETWKITAQLVFRGGKKLNSKELVVSIPDTAVPDYYSRGQGNTATTPVYLRTYLEFTPLLPRSKPLWPHLTPQIELPVSARAGTLPWGSCSDSPGRMNARGCALAAYKYLDPILSGQDVPARKTEREIAI
ncbi:MAG: hypothetical protein E7H98_11215, partial [Finegoldia magna]|nr:hypothetical protein [Finegoldia magna]